MDVIFDLNETQEDATLPPFAEERHSDSAEEQIDDERRSEQGDELKDESEAKADQFRDEETLKEGTDTEALQKESSQVENIEKESEDENREGTEAEPLAAETDETHRAGSSLPLSRVKRLVKLDPDIRMVSSEALKTIALATELFLESLAVSTAQVTRAGKRSMIKVEDLLQVVRTRRRYRECLGTELDRLRPVDANKAANLEAKQAQKQEKAARPLPPGVKPITNFFKQPAIS